MSGPLDVGSIRSGVAIDVAGLATRVVADDLDRAEAVASLFRDADLTEADPECEIRLTEAAPELPARPPDVTLERIAIWWSDDAMYLDVAGLRARADADGVWAGGDVPSIGACFRNACLQGLSRVFAVRGRFLTHGAVVVLRGGPVLVMGGSGVGKSTLTFAARRSGRGVVSDDAVVLDAPADGGPVRATGMPRPIAVPADVVEGLAVAGQAVPEDPRQRIEVDAGTRVDGPVTLAGLVIAAGADPRGAGIDRLTGPDVLHAILQTMQSFSDPAHRNAAFGIAGRLAQVPAWTMRRGNDPAAALAEVTEQLDRLDDLLDERLDEHRRTGGSG